MKINIHLGNSIKAMESMPDKKYGLAIVDTPYGINMAMGHKGSEKRGDKNKYKRFSGNDNTTPPTEYWDGLFRISKNQIIWGGNYMIEFLNPTPCFIVWDKVQPEKFSMAMAELAWTSFDTPAKIFKKRIVGADSERMHPTQKPVALYKWLLKNYGFNKDGSKRTILDTHGGSFSIVLACIDMGFDIDIWELDPDYYRDAVSRVKKHLQQLDAFREPVEINYIND